MVIGVDPIAIAVRLPVAMARISALTPLARRRQRDQNANRQAGCRCDYRTSGYADALQSALRGLAYGGTSRMSRLPNRLPKVLTSDAKPFQQRQNCFLPCVQRAEPGLPRWSRKRIEETCWELLMNGYSIVKI